MVCIGRHQKHDYANYYLFAPKFDITYKTIQRGYVPNLKLFGPLKTELWPKEFGGCSIMLYGKALAFIAILTWNLQRDFKTERFTLCKNFVKKIVNLNFWCRHCKRRILPYLFQIPAFAILKRVHIDEFHSNAKNNSIRGRAWVWINDPQVLSKNWTEKICAWKKLALTGVEPGTFRVPLARSNRLCHSGTWRWTANLIVMIIQLSGHSFQWEISNSL